MVPLCMGAAAVAALIIPLTCSAEQRMGRSEFDGDEGEDDEQAYGRAQIGLM